MIYITLIMLLIFQGTLITISPFFKNIDELIFVFLIMIVFYKVIIKKDKIVLYKYERISWILATLFLFFGSLSLVFSKVTNDYMYGILSGIQTVKSIISYFLLRICLSGKSYSDKVLCKINKCIDAVLWIYFTIAVANIKLKFLESTGIRYGISNIKCGFTHPATFEYCIISMMIIKIYILSYLNKSLKYFKITLLQCIVLVFLAGRSKGVAFMGIFILAYLFVYYIKKFKLRYLIYLIPLSVYLAWDRIITSLFSSDEARNVLYRTSFKIANEYFPFGSGFSTFGSDSSRVRYSPLYYKYGINGVWGLSEEKPTFITDTQWASIFGEGGYIGLLLYVFSILLILMVLININKIGMTKFIISSLFIYGLIASISDSILVSFRGMGIFMTVAFFVNLEISRRKEE